MRGRAATRLASRSRAARVTALLVAAIGTAMFATACSKSAPAATSAQASPAVTVPAAGPSSPATAAPSVTSAPPSTVPAAPVPGYCRHGGPKVWANLARCGWPGPANTGPDRSQCPGRRLASNAGPRTRTIRITTANTVISCQAIQGMLDIEARNVTVRNSVIVANSGKTGEAANGTAGIKVEDGASAVIDHVTINGDEGVHACVWHQGTSLVVRAVNCYGSNDGIFSWADHGYSRTTGDHFVISDSYFHDFTDKTSNGHSDGYQTEGASAGLIQHNTYEMTAGADSAIALWDSLRDSRGISVKDNLITGGGFAIYAEDYSPGDGAPGDPRAVGGYSVSDIRFTGNVFSTYAAGCVGKFGVWFDRPGWPPYGGGPTDGWLRHGNRVLETGQNLDHGNPSGPGLSCG
ncbi:MAG: hypothetical protein QOG05_4818 [Streptosporangiaceae bacterium]|nr:hypothetical protein [Streptosporangiaceae bacterium]